LFIEGDRMFHSTLNFTPKSQTRGFDSHRGSIHLARRGAILPLFTFLLPVLLILCGFAINLAYMQQVNTELKIATDAAAHAGGRAMSLFQSTDAAIAQATLTAQANLVGGRVMSIASNEAATGDDFEIIFGRSVRSNGGYGMYQFSEVPKSAIDSGAERATSVGVVSRVELPLIFNVMNQKYFGGSLSDFRVARRSVATQVDRDIALVLDKSGSMLWFKDENLLSQTLLTLYNTYDTTTEPGFWKYGHWSKRKNGTWRWQGYYTLAEANSTWTVRDWNDKQWTDGTTTNTRRISYTEYQNATKWLYDRFYSNNVVYQLERYMNPSHTLGDSFTVGESGQLTTDMAQYTYDWDNVSGAARHSRWYFLALGVNKFLDILEQTDQEELVSLVTFQSQAYLEYNLQATYDGIRSQVNGIMPYGGTAVGDGMLQGIPPIISGPLARPFAAKTIVVMTDGDSNAGVDPVTAAQSIVANNNATIHTVTFTLGANQAPMQSVAEYGQGRHYHADEGEALIAIFEEIANNLPTILTE